MCGTLPPSLSYNLPPPLPSTHTQLDPAQKRVVESSIRDMRLSGVGLDGAEKERFTVRVPCVDDGCLCAPVICFFGL